MRSTRAVALVVLLVNRRRRRVVLSLAPAARTRRFAHRLLYETRRNDARNSERLFTSAPGGRERPGTPAQRRAVRSRAGGRRTAERRASDTLSAGNARRGRERFGIDGDGRLVEGRRTSSRWNVRRKRHVQIARVHRHRRSRNRRGEDHDRRRNAADAAREDTLSWTIRSIAPIFKTAVSAGARSLRRSRCRRSPTRRSRPSICSRRSSSRTFRARARRRRSA